MNDIRKQLAPPLGATDAAGGGAMSDIRKQLEDLVSEIFPREDWMTDAKHRFMVDKAMQAMGGLDALEAAVRVGVANGYSVQAQLDIVRRGVAAWRRL